MPQGPTSDGDGSVSQRGVGAGAMRRGGGSSLQQTDSGDSDQLGPSARGKRSCTVPAAPQKEPDEAHPTDSAEAGGSKDARQAASMADAAVLGISALPTDHTDLLRQLMQACRRPGAASAGLTPQAVGAFIVAQQQAEEAARKEQLRALQRLERERADMLHLLLRSPDMLPAAAPLMAAGSGTVLDGPAPPHRGP